MFCCECITLFAEGNILNAATPYKDKMVINFEISFAVKTIIIIIVIKLTIAVNSKYSFGIFCNVA